MIGAGGVNSGWANNCGVELFTVGWVQCPQDTGKRPGYHGVDLAGQYAQAWREDEELLMIARLFVEIIRCRH